MKELQVHARESLLWVPTLPALFFVCLSLCL